MEKLSLELAGLANAYEKMAEETNIDDKDIYSCIICRDCGWVFEGDRAKPCSCQKTLKEEQKLLAIPHLQKMSFANYDLKMYPENIKTQTTGKSYRFIAREALSAAMSFANSIARGISRPGLIFEGDVGSGKTFLAAAIANNLITKGVNVEFIIVPEFLDELRNNIQKEGDNNNILINRIKNSDVLILDDMGAHNFSPWVQNILFTIVNYRLNHQLPIIITTNLNYDQMEDTLGERIASRLMETGPNIKLFTDKDIRLKLFKEGRYKW